MGRFQRRQAADIFTEETAGSRLARGWHRIVAARAENQEPLEIDFVCELQALQGCSYAVVFHVGHDKVSVAAGPHFDPIIRPMREHGAVPIGARSKAVTL